LAIANDAKNNPHTTGTEGRRRRSGRSGAPGGAPMAPGGPPGMAMPGMAGMPGAGGGAGSGTRSSLDYYTGELGKSLLEKLEAKVDEGIFGNVQGEMGMPTAGPANPGMMVGAPAMAPPGGEPGAEPGGGDGAAPAGGGARGKDEAGAIRPGITFLGNAATKEALEKKAKEQGLDVLILFDVKVQRPGKTKIVRNSTKISVLLVDRPQEIPVHTSAMLTNVEVAAEREKDKDGDPVDEEMDKLIAKLESYTTAAGTPQTLKLSPFLETLAPQHAANRVASLTASPTDQPLAVLAEIKLYHSKKLISDQQFQEAAKVFLKDKADLLAKGKEDERRKALDSLFPKKVAKR
jgi:hypothetical protein